MDELIAHARESYPLECCGIIAGSGTRIEQLVRIPNTIESPVEYKMDDAAVKSALDMLDAARLDFLGVYHSHPKSAAYPSNSDTAKAPFPELDYVIISLIDIEKPVIKNFSIDNNVIIEEPLEIIFTNT